MMVMTQKVCIERVEVRGAAPYLGMCVDVEGCEMPVWSDDPRVVLDWLCDAWRCRYNQLRTRRMKWNRGRSELVPLGGGGGFPYGPAGARAVLVAGVCAGDGVAVA